MKKIILSFGILFISMGLSTAQPFNIELNFAAGTPQGDFMQELDRNSYGLDMAFTYQIPYSFVHIGAGFTYQNFGWNERRENLYGIPEVDLRVRTTNNMVTPHLLMRLESPFGSFKPFVEGIIGFNYLYTESSLIDDWEEDDLASSINYDYLTSSFGLGGGAKIKLYDGFDDDGDYFGLSLIIKSRVTLGGEALYLKEGDLERVGDELNLNIRQSRTDLTTFNVGVVFNF